MGLMANQPGQPSDRSPYRDTGNKTANTATPSKGYGIAAIAVADVLRRANPMRTRVSQVIHDHWRRRPPVRLTRKARFRNEDTRR